MNERQKDSLMKGEWKAEEEKRKKKKKLRKKRENMSTRVVLPINPPQ